MLLAVERYMQATSCSLTGSNGILKTHQSLRRIHLSPPSLLRINCYEPLTAVEVNQLNLSLGQQTQALNKLEWKHQWKQKKLMKGSNYCSGEKHGTSNLPIFFQHQMGFKRHSKCLFCLPFFFFFLCQCSFTIIT